MARDAHDRPPVFLERPLHTEGFQLCVDAFAAAFLTAAISW